MIDNVPEKTGRPLEEWFDVLDAAALDKHGQALAFLKNDHGVSHGFANLIVTLHRDRDAGPKTGADLVDALRRSEQFAVVEAPSAKRVQLGLNLRGVAPTDRLRPMTGMCTHRVDLASLDDVVAEVLGWLRAAYDLA